jgi:hypothetical protein
MDGDDPADRLSRPQRDTNLSPRPHRQSFSFQAITLGGTLRTIRNYPADIVGHADHDAEVDTTKRQRGCMSRMNGPIVATIAAAVVIA